MPPMDGAQWLALFQGGAANDVSSNLVFPEQVTLRTPALTMAGQSWNNVTLSPGPMPGERRSKPRGVKSTQP